VRRSSGVVVALVRVETLKVPKNTAPRKSVLRWPGPLDEFSEHLASLRISSSQRTESPHRMNPLSGWPPTSPGSPREGGILQIAENRDKSVERKEPPPRSAILHFLALMSLVSGLRRDPPNTVTPNSGFRRRRPRMRNFFVVLVRNSRDNCGGSDPRCSY